MDRTNRELTAGLKKLETSTLPEALRGMERGETCLAPDGYTPRSVIKTCSEMRAEGYVFQTSRKTGVMTITRLQ